MTTFHCRDCGREQAHFSRRRSMFERVVLPLFLLRPVRCSDCFRRQYVPVFCEISNGAQRPGPPEPPRRMAA